MPSAASRDGEIPPGKIWWILTLALILPTLSALLYFVIFKEAAVSKPGFSLTQLYRTDQTRPRFAMTGKIAKNFAEPELWCPKKPPILF